MANTKDLNRFQRAGRVAVVWTLKSIGLEDLFLTGKEHIAFSSGVGGGKPGGVDVNQAPCNSWIAYACVTNQATDLSGVPLRVLTDPDEMDSEVLESDPVRKLFDQPMPGLSQSMFIQWLFLFMNYRGASFVVFDDPAKPTRMIPFKDPLWWRGVPTPEGSLAQWVFNRGKTTPYFPSDIIVNRMPDITSPWGWQSPLVAASNALTIDQLGSHLKESTYAQGGGQPPEYKTDEYLSDAKYRQLTDRIRDKMQTPPGMQNKPHILTDGMDRVDPRFTMQDLRILENQAVSAEQVAAIYNMSPSLIWREDEANRDTIKIRQRKYWTEALMPLAHSQEDAFDSYFAERFDRYVRFDFSKVEALQADRAELVEIGVNMSKMHVPLDQIEEALQIGITTDDIPWSHESFGNINSVSLSALLSGFSLDDVGGSKGLNVGGSSPAATSPAPPAPSSIRDLGSEAFRKLMIRRANDVNARIEQNKARMALSNQLTKVWRRIAIRLRSDAVKAALTWDGDLTALKKKFAKLSGPASEQITDKSTPIIRKAAVEGVISILDLVAEEEDERMYRDGRADHVRQDPSIPQAAADVIKKRVDYISNMPDRAFDDIIDEVERAVLEDAGPTAQDVANFTRKRFDVEISKAVMIGRTEVGTAYNSSRFVAMGEQGFEKHEWLTAGDSDVRGNDSKDAFNHVSSNGKTRKVGKQFPSGLKYPQEDGGEAGNVINCRCLTIPAK